MRRKFTTRRHFWRGKCGEESTRQVLLSSCTWDFSTIYVMNVSQRAGSKCIKYVHPQDKAEYLQFLRKSQAGALEEENRRYRFLAEKNCSLIQSIAQIMNKVHCLRQRHSKSTIYVIDEFEIVSWFALVQCQIVPVCQHIDLSARMLTKKAF